MKWNKVPVKEDKSWFVRRGFAFERILKECLDVDGLEPRSSYKPKGEQIDGSFFLDGSVFLLEAKWQKSSLPASSLYQFKGKVDGKLSGTLGIFVSMSNYSKDAVDALTLGKSLNIILFGREDIEHAILGKRGFKCILKEKLRVAAEQGVVFHSIKIEQATEQGHTSTDSFTFKSTPPIQQHEKSFTSTSDLIVICEGKSDSELISRFVTKILNQAGITKKVNILTANGKMAIPRVANTSLFYRPKASVLIVADADNDYEETLNMLKRGVEISNWKYSIPEPSIECWLGIEDRKEFMRRYHGSKRQLIMLELLNDINLDDLAEKDKSFKTFYEWVKSA